MATAKAARVGEEYVETLHVIVTFELKFYRIWKYAWFCLLDWNSFLMITERV